MCRMVVVDDDGNDGAGIVDSRMWGAMEGMVVAMQGTWAAEDA